MPSRIDTEMLICNNSPNNLNKCTVAQLRIYGNAHKFQYNLLQIMERKLLLQCFLWLNFRFGFNYTQRKKNTVLFFSSLYATAFASEGSLLHVLMWANEKHLFIYSTPDILRQQHKSTDPFQISSSKFPLPFHKFFFSQFLT